jgi:hypothetical protein
MYAVLASACTCPCAMCSHVQPTGSWCGVWQQQGRAVSRCGVCRAYPASMHAGWAPRRMAWMHGMACRPFHAQVGMAHASALASWLAGSGNRQWKQAGAYRTVRVWSQYLLTAQQRMHRHTRALWQWGMQTAQLEAG